MGDAAADKGGGCHDSAPDPRPPGGLVDRPEAEHAGLGHGGPRGPSGGRRTGARRWRRVAFLGLVLACTAVVGELAARALLGEPTAGIVAHPYLRRVRAPGSSQTLLDPWTRRPFVLHVDEHGFRCRTLEPPGVPKDPRSYRIFFVGASTTENIVLPDEQTFPVLVAEELTRRVGDGTRVHGVNTALSGNSVADSLSLVAHRLTALEPDLIVVLHAVNDMRATLSRRFDPAHYADRIEPAPPTLGAWLRGTSRAVQAFERTVEKFRREDVAEKYRARRRSRPKTPVADVRAGAPYFRRYLEMIAAVCRQARVPLALMTMPSLYREDLTPEEEASLWLGWVAHGELNLDTPTLLEGMRAYNEVIREVARAEGALLVDLEPVVPKDLRHFYDDVHTTALGNEVVAKAVVEALWAGGGLPRRRR